MAWFLNYYTCDRCGEDWTDEWSCMCDDDCPRCGARHMTPYESDDLTCVVEPCGGRFVALGSPDGAEHSPDYFEMASFATRAEAEGYVARMQQFNHLIDHNKLL